MYGYHKYVNYCYLLLLTMEIKWKVIIQSNDLLIFSLYLRNTLFREINDF